MILGMAGVFVFGYLVMNSLDAFLDAGSGRRYHRHKKKGPSHPLFSPGKLFSLKVLTVRGHCDTLLTDQRRRV